MQNSDAWNIPEYHYRSIKNILTTHSAAFQMPREDKRANFLTDLGRATMRGVRKCPKCGTLNGTRGFSCKNKSCDVIFKEAGEKKKHSTEACRITAGTDTQVGLPYHCSS